MHAHTRRQTWGWRVRKKGGAPTPATSLSSFSPFLSLFFPSPLSLSFSRSFSLDGSSLFALLQRSLDRDPFLSNSTLPLPPVPTPFPLNPLASSFAAALSSSALLSGEKGWLLERKRGLPKRGWGRGAGEGGAGRSIGGGSATTNGGGQDERWVQRTEPSQLQDN